MEGKKEDLPDYEQLRLKNIEENRKKMLELGLILQNNIVIEDEVKPLQEKNLNGQKRKHNKLKIAEPMRKIPTRQSLRLSQDEEMEMMDYKQISYMILGDDSNYCELTKDQKFEEQFLSEDDSSDESERIVCVAESSDSYDEDSDEQSKKRKRRESSFGPRKRVRAESTTGPREVLPPEEITEEMLKNIAEFATGKTYSQTDGTTCHQCRQKTTDQKSICRSKQCFGVRGQYCGPCLKNRYGESVKDALMNPDWNCPVCKGICNCSICRTDQGKAPTGQLAPFALSNGFNSVHDLLAKEEPDDD